MFIGVSPPLSGLISLPFTDLACFFVQLFITVAFYYDVAFERTLNMIDLMCVQKLIEACLI